MLLKKLLKNREEPGAQIKMYKNVRWWAPGYPVVHIYSLRDVILFHLMKIIYANKILP